MTTSSPDFTDLQKSALVQQIITGGLSLQQACAQYGLSTEQLKEWVCLFRRAARQALDHQLRDTLSVQGLDLDLSRGEFSGDLADIGVADLLQTIQMGRKDAHITVTHGGQVSQIWCRAGQVIDACSGSLTGKAAFFRTLAIEHGSLIAHFAPTRRARRIQLSTPRLLLEAASSTGLRTRLMHRIGDPRQVFTFASDAAAGQAAHFDADELEVSSLFDGARSVEEIVLLSGLPDARALEIIAHFREQNLLSTEAPSGAAEAALGSPAPSSQITMSYRPFVASAAPEPIVPPAWALACGAVLCSSAGAVTAIAYANSLGDPSRLELEVQAASARGIAPTPSAELPPEAVLQPHGSRAVPASAAEFGAGGPASSAAMPREDTRPSAAVPTNVPVDLHVPSAARRIAPVAPPCPPEMVWIEGGEFMMGTDSNRPALALARPPHRVRVGGFCMGVHEVTTGEYGVCADAGACTPAHQGAHFADEASEDGSLGEAAALHGAMCNAGRSGRDDHPINCVSHAQAAAYCRARGERLPTEAEWEFAARGAEARAFPWGDERPTRAHVNACGKECERRDSALGRKNEPHGLVYAADDGYSGTAPVGSFPLGSSPQGVEDLIGNVFEWTAHGLYTYDRYPTSDPTGPDDSDSRVIRGGNFNSAIREFLDPALRFEMHRLSYSHGVGFRCAADAAPPAPRD